jgi:hypothetical protein
MSRTSGVLAAMKAVPGGARHTPAPQSGGWGAMNSVAANAQWGSPYASSNSCLKVTGSPEIGYLQIS